jgi:hypothetical protein
MLQQKLQRAYAIQSAAEEIYRRAQRRHRGQDKAWVNLRDAQTQCLKLEIKLSREAGRRKAA